MSRRIGERITSHFGAHRGAANLGGEPAFGPACPPAEQVPASALRDHCARADLPRLYEPGALTHLLSGVG